MNEATLLFDDTPVPVVEDVAGGRRRRLITLATGHMQTLYNLAATLFRRVS